MDFFKTIIPPVETDMNAR